MTDLTNPTPNPQSPTPSTTPSPKQPTVLRCLTSSAVAGAIAYAAYLLMLSIAQTFAKNPIHSGNLTAIRLSAAVKTFVIGIIALGASVFAFAAAGLFALGLQLLIQRLIQRFMKQPNSPSGV
ncbi:MAG: DUF3082 domain-containing protein [Actinomycetota bacterium]